MVLSAVLVLSATACGNPTGTDAPAAGASTSTTEPMSALMERRVGEFVTAYLQQALTQRPGLNGSVPKDEFTGCVTGKSLGAARAVYGSRQLPAEDSADRLAAENAAAGEALSAAQTGIESAIASCARK